MKEYVSFNASVEEALHSDRVIRYVVGKNGFWELSNTNNYDVLTHRNEIVGPETPFKKETISFNGQDYIYSKDGFWLESGIEDVYKQVFPTENIIEPYFNFKLPMIPRSILYELVLFFKNIYLKYKTEILAEIYFDEKNQQYLVHIPQQQVSASRVFYSKDELPLRRVAEFHSHHILPAVFSSIDDKDETTNGIIYGVIGAFSEKEPSKFNVSLRVRDKNDFTYLKLCDIFDSKNSKVDMLNLQARIHKWKKQIFVQTKKSKV